MSIKFRLLLTKNVTFRFGCKNAKNLLNETLLVDNKFQ